MPTQRTPYALRDAGHPASAPTFHASFRLLSADAIMTSVRSRIFYLIQVETP
jgi:hypothetical protein